ncbi:unnamed protein product [Owenia fusiformis]|uniref:Uncharacterized protein n=1 Tax=Owenia fusiformis TaxID=6347 RepID=A0A8S4P5P5_OWEFU|nr:unnamed protein product [Owenia fusiformis]
MVKFSTSWTECCTKHEPKVSAFVLTFCPTSWTECCTKHEPKVSAFVLTFCPTSAEFHHIEWPIIIYSDSNIKISKSRVCGTGMKEQLSPDRAPDVQLRCDVTQNNANYRLNRAWSCIYG